MAIASGSITATATTNGASTTRAYNGSLSISSLQLTLASVTAGTLVTFQVYDNNVAASLTAATGNTWSSKSPGYSGQGPGTAAIDSQNMQSARYGDQQGQTAPNTAGVKQYWVVDDSTGNIDYTAAPGPVDTGPFSASGDGTFNNIDNSSATGNVVAAVTAARLLYQVTLAAGASATWTPNLDTAATFGLNIVTSSPSATALAGTYNLTYTPLP